MFVGAGGRQATAKAGADGRFSVQLKPGRYAVTGRSPQFNDGQGSCQVPGTFEASEFHEHPFLTVSCPRR